MDIEEVKVDIETEKVDIESMLAEKGRDFSAKTAIHMIIHSDKFNF